MRHRRHRRHHHHHRGHHRRWRRGWGRIRSVQRRLLAFLFLAFALGAGGGIAFGFTHAYAASSAPWCVAIAAVTLLWPLAWLATFRIARPIVELARVAHDLRGGDLDQRQALDTGDDEVGEVAGALRGMADRVAQQLEHQRALMAAVSHELRSPLARVRVLVELAREGRPPPDLHDDLQAEIDGMDALVGDLLAASRIDFEAVSPRPLPVRDVCTRALELAAVDDVALTGDLDGELVADPTLLARALSVMLDNARRYGAPPVSLHVVREAGAVRLEVLDRGPGFADGEADQAFEPFWRKPSRRGSPSAGAGLGLALVRQIAQAHGGRAFADNRPDGGARVTVELPLDP